MGLPERSQKDFCENTSKNLKKIHRKNAKNSRFSASKWTMEAAESMREHRLSDPWPPEGRLWAQKGPKITNKLILKTGFLSSSYTPQWIPYGIHVRPLQLARGAPRRSRPPPGARSDRQVATLIQSRTLPSCQPFLAMNGQPPTVGLVDSLGPVRDSLGSIEGSWKSNF